MSYFDTAMVIKAADGEDVFASKSDELMESSSTIKLPIVIMAIEKMAADGFSLAASLRRQPHHATKGSGILNWTEAGSFSFKDLLQTILVYSDCLATNILIDFVGGQSEVNSWLERRGMKTRLLMPYLIFTDEEITMPRVGQTTAREMSGLFELFENLDCPPDIKQLVRTASSHVHESWLEIGMSGQLAQLRHKTGSMIDCGQQGETVFNAAGRFTKSGKNYLFCLLSHGFLRHQGKVIPFENMRRDVADVLHAKVRDYC